jgi:succinoglycan biosynthesis protein ExoA
MESMITILIPCRNEENYIRPCLESVLAFELPPGGQIEILVLDGRSTDRTRTLVDEIAARDARIRWLDNTGITQSCALNLGISRARGQWIMRLDAHTQYPSDYLARCYATAVSTSAANVGGVCATQPGGFTYQAQLVQALTTHKFGVGDSGFRTGASEGPRDTVPFGFFRRELFAAIGLFDERLVRAQDYEFNRRIKASGGVVWLNPAIHSFYYNQPTLGAFYRKQLLQEAPYNAYLWYLAPYAFAPRHAITGVFTLGVLGGLALSPLTPWIAWPFAAVLTLYALLALASAAQQAVRYRSFLHVFCLPPCFFLYHFIHGFGVLTGLLRLLTRTAPVQKIHEPWPGAGYRRVPVRRLRLHQTTLEPSSP